MDSVELCEFVTAFGHAIGRVEETGERVSVTDGGEPVGVLLPAAELAELEHFAQRVHGGPRPRPRVIRERPVGPEQRGPYIRYVHADGLRMTFARDRVVVAELRSVDELIWYTPGETPFAPSAPLALLDLHIRRAEEETDWADGIPLFFAGLERAFGLSLPRDALASGQVRCARPARR
ncbi:type II toxin-antitoxin system prevent-host-death family antitoxin [Streptomyces smyrnaeus]|uniref:type II toxin-antitoxin system prevent-host-death family antitoxin n=1 Tax=Streptomyces smyrnaeus TaxID=1387713 RepID=UPI0036AEA508